MQALSEDRATAPSVPIVPLEMAAAHCLVIDELAWFWCSKIHKRSPPRATAWPRRPLFRMSPASWSSNRGPNSVYPCGMFTACFDFYHTMNQHENCTWGSIRARSSVGRRRKWPPSTLIYIKNVCINSFRLFLPKPPCYSYQGVFFAISAWPGTTVCMHLSRPIRADSERKSSKSSQPHYVCIDLALLPYPSSIYMNLSSALSSPNGNSASSRGGTTESVRKWLKRQQSGYR